jgi:hypothetical protein
MLQLQTEVLKNHFKCNLSLKVSVFRIRDVLIGTDPDPALFFSGFKDANKNFFLLITYLRYIKKSHNCSNQGIQ